MIKKGGITPQQAQKIREAKGLKDSNLTKFRLKKGYSQGDLAEASGLTKRAIQAYEQGTRSIEGARLDSLCNLCQALECKIEDILENKETIELYKTVK